MAIRVSRVESQQKTRSKLLNAAAAVFTAKGYGGATVDDILKESGLSKGGMYANFPSKEALFLELLDRCLEEQFRSIREIMTRSTSLNERIEAIGKWAPIFIANPREWRMLSTEFWLHAVRNPDILPQLATRYALQRQEVAAVIEEGYAQVGQAPPLPPLVLAAAVIGMINGLSVQQVIDPSAISNQDYPSALSQLLGFNTIDKN